MKEVERYRENVGKEPETRFPDDPDWLYRGTKTEREELAERLFGEDTVEVHPDQESLFEEGT